MMLFSLRRIAPASTSRYVRQVFTSSSEYRSFLAQKHGTLPKGFKVATTSFPFTPEEAPHLPSKMTMTMISVDEPTDKFAAVFTRNSFPGAPVKVGRSRLNEESIGALVINNKISNVCAKGGGVGDAEQVCDAVAKALDLSNAGQVLPSSTGVIGWRIPVPQMVQAVPDLVSKLSSDSILPAAEGIMTTDLFPKIRSVNIAGGRIVAIAKGAGMIEPNMATMLAFILTDLDIPRETLREILPRVVENSFNSISVDSDESTSDTAVLLSSGVVKTSPDVYNEVEAAVEKVCKALSEDIVRNGEGVEHVIKVIVEEAPSEDAARAIGKSIVNSPLFKCAVAGNDPNVGRLIMSIGKYVGKHLHGVSLEACRIIMGDVEIFRNGEFCLDKNVEEQLVDYMKSAQLIWSGKESESSNYSSKYDAYPPNDKSVEIIVNLGVGNKSATVIGADLTYGYVECNADYRS